jgi:YD repeat-containing protein
MTYPTGLALGYGYDGYGRLSSVTSNLGGTWATLADSFLYEPSTQRRYAWRFGNNLPKLITLDTDGRISQLASANVHSLCRFQFIVSLSSFHAVTENLSRSLSGKAKPVSVRRHRRSRP